MNEDDLEEVQSNILQRSFEGRREKELGSGNVKEPGHACTGNLRDKKSNLT